MHQKRLRNWLWKDFKRLHLLEALETLGLEDAWIAAGFLRSLAWDRLHERAFSPLPEDIDVIFYEAHDLSFQREDELTRMLQNLAPGIPWSVKNQARMHLRNGDLPYQDCEDAMRYWPETATAIAVRLKNSELEFLAPYGLADLMELKLRPCPLIRKEKQEMFQQRTIEKQWRVFWPRLIIESWPQTQEESG